MSCIKVQDQHPLWKQYCYVSKFGIPVCTQPTVSRSLQEKFRSKEFCSNGDGGYKFCDEQASMQSYGVHQRKLSIPQTLRPIQPVQRKMYGTIKRLPRLPEQAATGAEAKRKPILRKQKQYKRTVDESDGKFKLPEIELEIHGTPSTLIRKTEEYATKHEVKHSKEQTGVLLNQGKQEAQLSQKISVLQNHGSSVQYIDSNARIVKASNEDEQRQDKESSGSDSVEEENKSLEEVSSDGDECNSKIAEIERMSMKVMQALEKDNQLQKYDNVIEKCGWRGEAFFDPYRVKPIHQHLPYFVKIPPQAVERYWPERHYKIFNPFFLNTIPYMQHGFVVHPDFISEHSEGRHAPPKRTILK